MRKGWIVLSWLAVVCGIGGYLGHALVADKRAIFLPGATTRGHYQIDARCETCHTPGQGVEQDACLDCHAEELETKDDSHAPSAFADPRNAELLERIDARRCVTCHGEHRPRRTRRMGVTQPAGFCEHCHADVGDERPTHEGRPFSSCRDAGCHNYHDNRALNADFLRDESSAPDHLVPARVPPRSGAEVVDRGARLTIADARAPGDAAREPIADAWSGSAHARAGVNCTDCHGRGSAWRDLPGADACSSCHEAERAGFEAGLHGMRVAAGLSPMTPSRARSPMNPDQGHRQLTCTSCHGAHEFDTRHAAADACLDCHADEHSLAYRGSPHHDLWRAELAGRVAAGAGVSCATCHMPRIATGGERARVEHNQSLTIRPREAMVKPVCSHCHGAPFSIAALADDASVRDNFRAAPPERAESFELLRERDQKGEP